MKKLNLQTLLQLLSNYAEKSSHEDTVALLNKVYNLSKKPLTEERKKHIYTWSIAALNGEAYKEAFELRLEALCSEDDELIDAVEYMHMVL